jgi:hypothetical protein
MGNKRGRPKGHAPSYTGGRPGYVWYNNGVEERLIKPGTVLEGDGWEHGRLDHMLKARESRKPEDIFNLGEYNKMKALERRNKGE